MRLGFVAGTIATDKVRLHSTGCPLPGADLSSVGVPRGTSAPSWFPSSMGLYVCGPRLESSGEMGTRFCWYAPDVHCQCLIRLTADGMMVVPQVLAFERLLFRATRGNMYLKHSAVGAVADPITGDKQEKEVFIVFFAGERARSKILKVGSEATWGVRQGQKGGGEAL